MKRIICIISGSILFSFCFMQLKSQSISIESAIDIATMWFQHVNKEKGNRSVRIESVVQNKDKDDELPSFYGVNFEEGGCVIVSSEESVGPILAYSRTESFNEAKFNIGEQKW